MRLFILNVLILQLGLLHSAWAIDFAHEVIPVLEKHCIECHGGDESKGGLSMNTRSLVLEADVVELGEPKSSLLIEVLTEEDPEFRMPPPDKNKPALNDAEIKVLERWISEGLPWEEGFTFANDRYEPPLRPRAVKIPAGPPGANPIDLIVAEHFKDKSLDFPKPADDATFVRRASLDLIGLPTSSQAGEKPLKDLNREQFIDGLLADNQGYAEHWLTFWNDLLRNDYNGTGYITGGRRQITAWLYPALVKNKPYNDFVAELVAPTKESSGFINGIKWRGEVNASQTPQIQFSQNISQVFLGINMKCASCHDSFVDRWTLKDAYDLAAIYSEKPLELERCDKPTGVMAKPGWLYPELGQIDASKPRDERLKQLASLITDPQNGRMQRTIVNRLWMKLMGRGIVHPVDAMNTEPWNEDLLDLLANHLVSSGYDLKAVLRLITTSKIYQARAEVRENENEAYVFRGPVRKRMTAEQFLDSIRSVTKIWPEAKKGVLKALEKGRGRLAVVMEAHGIEEWDNRPIRAAFENRDSLQAALGRPNRDQVVTSRPDAVTTLEAINLSNGPELAGLIKSGAEAIRTTTDPKELVQKVFMKSLSREPNTQELRISEGILGSDPSGEDVEDFLWSVFMLPEFHYIN